MSETIIVFLPAGVSPDDCVVVTTGAEDVETNYPWLSKELIINGLTPHRIVKKRKPEQSTDYCWLVETKVNDV